MRSYQRSLSVDGKADTNVLDSVGMTEAQAKEMYQLLGIANYEDRFVIPTAHEEMVQEDPYAFQGQNGFTPGNMSSHGSNAGEKLTLFPTPRKRTYTPPGIQSGKKDKV